MDSETVYLRALEAEDGQAVFRWHNSADLYGSLGGAFRFVSKQADAEWMRQKMQYSTSEVNLAICLTASDEHIGNIYLREIDWIARHGEIHVFIGDADNRGAGHGRSALRQMIRHAFDDLGLLRLYLFVLEENGSAIRSYESQGFIVEGCLRNHAHKNGKSKNVLIMGLLREVPSE